jgi:hypothetical protein
MVRRSSRGVKAGLHRRRRCNSTVIPAIDAVRGDIVQRDHVGTQATNQLRFDVQLGWWSKFHLSGTPA